MLLPSLACPLLIPAGCSGASFRGNFLKLFVPCLCQKLPQCLSFPGPAELLEAWLSQFHLEEKKGEIAELLATSPSIRALYTKMVRSWFMANWRSGASGKTTCLTRVAVVSVKFRGREG